MQTLDVKLVHGPLKILLQTVIDQLLHRQQINPNDNLAILCELFVKTADNNYDAIRCLIKKSPQFSIPALTICRSSLDLVFTLCLIMCKPSKYVLAYKKSGWREKYEKLQHEQSSNWMNAHQSDWLQKYAKFVDASARIEGVTAEEKKNPKRITYFPMPSQMLRWNSEYYQDMDNLTKRVLEKLLSEYYKHLSQISHVSSPGLAMHIYPTLKSASNETKGILSADSIFNSWMCILCLLSEINIHFRYQHGNKLKELWTYLNLTIPVCDEIYRAKYQAKL